MIEVFKLEAPSEYIANELGRIMPFLSSNHDGSPINIDYLQRVTDSISSVQLIARPLIKEQEDLELMELAKDYPIVGAATLSTLHGVLGEKAWLEDFVVVPAARKQGVAQLLWDAMIDWRNDKGLYQMRFNSTADRERAHSFYFRNGCKELSTGKTTLFVHNIDRPNS